ncbi:hypothetical protein H6F51_24405 [Cyanobacteria bacterium FACHB-DQ100]|uniref:hypothetical protein n=1 Tax=unclassified Leptolyngbya TaxID=2650499 RepID=UPI001680E19F|nr:hypothetical protein [Leptolyngbya sp. FACHB-17]MBD1825615.1 hypothetical protein [Cyanobacteria bacterium FACHB-DQ100]MBD2079646.1 hypothetical protein [Leptolyngbya sp. FACHB-17]
MKIPLLSACVALFATAITWRGIWVLADAYLYPNNPALSALWSFVLGLFSFLVLKLVIKHR